MLLKRNSNDKNKCCGRLECGEFVMSKLSDNSHNKVHWRKLIDYRQQI